MRCLLLLILCAYGAQQLCAVGARAAVVDVRLDGTTFSPAVVHVRVGDQVRFSWDSDELHSTNEVSSEAASMACTLLPPPPLGGGYQHASSLGGTLLTAPFTSAGTHFHICQVHCHSNGMRGQVVVEAAAATDTCVCNGSHGVRR